jgi:uncharacterized protein YbjT (DUF2867 family)
MNIGVTGASGHLGSATVRELKARLGTRANIVAISCTPSKIADLGSKRAQAISTSRRRSRRHSVGSTSS